MISWICFITTVISIYFAGDRKCIGPLFACLGFIPWTWMAVSTEQWGLLALNCVILALQARALWKWRKDGLSWI